MTRDSKDQAHDHIRNKLFKIWKQQLKGRKAYMLSGPDFFMIGFGFAFWFWFGFCFGLVLELSSYE